MAGLDPLIFGHRLRHLRRQRGWTLEELGRRVGKPASYLSTVETGKREPRFSLINDLATALEVEPADLLATEAPTRRARLEVALERFQEDPLYRELELPHLKATAGLSDTALEHIVRLYQELRRRTHPESATPEEARRANRALRDEMRACDNYFEDIEKMAAEALAAIGYEGAGAVPQRALSELAAHFGFSVLPVPDLPGSVRSVTDRRHGRIYIPQRDSLRTRAARSVVLQTLGQVALGHGSPRNFDEYLRQRVEANYFAGAVLAPEGAAVPFLLAAQAQRDVSVEDLKEVFYISYEMAAHRFTNLATRHLGLRVHFLRSDADGVIWKAYENNGVPFPRSGDGSIEGQRLCRQWGTRMAFSSEDKFAIHYQYTDTPEGTFWCATHVEADRVPYRAVTVGARFDEAQFFRGRDTDRHSVSRCPDTSCCRRADPELAARWSAMASASTLAHSHERAVMGSAYPEVDLVEIYEFLERHAAG